MVSTKSPISHLQGFIQAGGRSSRMGTDKAWLEINGRPMIECVLAAAQPVVNELAIVINPANAQAQRYEQLATQWNARLLHDLHDHKGPLGGIHTALQHCAADEAALILACDLPFLTSDVLTHLCHKHKSSTAQITVPLDESGRSQPLAAIYDQACLPIATEMIARDELKVDRLFAQVATQLVSYDELAQLPNNAKFFANLNAPEDWQSLYLFGQTS
jgi:molybdenum cofactor guanylyltransferase